MKFMKKVSSAIDNVQKYIFKNEEDCIVEFSYIDNNTNKDIICVPSHTMCNMGCKFCHATDYIGKIPSFNLRKEEIVFGVEYISKDLNLNRKALLISYMGLGEPMLNVNNVIESMLAIKSNFSDKNVRFAVATCLPKSSWENFFKFTKLVQDFEIDVKVHLSLHYTENETRKRWMPKSLEIESSLAAMSFYKQVTGNKVEIHYALIEGVNDTTDDLMSLGDLLSDKGFNVKFLFYNEKESLNAKASNMKKYNEFSEYLWSAFGIETEYYVPPGTSIGASCGAFLMDYYVEYSKI